MPKHEWTPFQCYTLGKKVTQHASCGDCDWRSKRVPEAPDNASLVFAQVTEHVRQTGHHVDREYTSRTSYGGQPNSAPRPPQKQQRTVFCITCKKQMALKARGIMLFWAASSHHKASGHEIEVRNADGSIAAHYP